VGAVERIRRNAYAAMDDWIDDAEVFSNVCFLFSAVSDIKMCTCF
jgi:hypothetical protein